MRKTKTVGTAATVVVTMMIAVGAAAQEPVETDETAAVQIPRQRDWHLRIGLVVADTNDKTTVMIDPGSVDVRLGGGAGGFISLERKVTPLLGLEFGMTGIGTDINVSAHTGLKHLGTDVDVLAMGALTVGANFHLVREDPIHVYAGPLLSFNRFSKMSVRAGIDHDWWPTKHHRDHWASVRIKSDSEVSWGAKAGLDLLLGKKKRWTLGCSVTYLDATYRFEPESGDGRISIDLNPVMLGFGAGFRF